MVVWDLPIRLFHWLLALSFAAAYISAQLGPAWMEWHMLAGYLVAALLLFRLGWGFCGSRTARFSAFIAGPRRVFAYLRALVARKVEPHAGHNPAGGWMVVAMLAVLFAATATGFFADDLIIYSGPLASCVSGDAVDRFTHFHALASDVALVLVGVHVLAILLYALLLRQRLVADMLGVRWRAASVPPLPFASPWLALSIFLAALALIALLAYLPICSGWL